MDCHQNARLTPRGREALVLAVLEEGLTAKPAAARPPHPYPPPSRIARAAARALSPPPVAPPALADQPVMINPMFSFGY